jgi:1-acyl-sn-glycerol-3-phosphate acyltransferase
MVWEITNLLLLNAINKFLLEELKGIKNIPDPPFIIASNHSSYLDGFIISKIVYDMFRQKTCFIANTKNWGYRLGKTIFLDYAACIPTDLPKDRFFAMINAKLKSGEVIGIFPEGDRSTGGKFNMFRKGVGRMAVESEAPVVPVAIKGTDILWPPGKKLPGIKKVVRVNIGKPLRFVDYRKSDKNYIKVAAVVEKVIKRLYKAL